MTDSLSEVIALYNQPRFLNPYTVSALRREFAQLPPVDHIAPSRHQRHLRDFLRTLLDTVMTALNVEYLTELTHGFTEMARTLPEPDYSDLGLVNNDHATYAEIQIAIQKIYELMQRVNKTKEEAHHYIGVVRTAENYAKGIRAAIRAFISDELDFTAAFGSVGERARFLETLLVDLDAVLAALATMKAQLTMVIDKSCTPRTATLLRMESSVRLLANYTEADRRMDVGFSRHKTTAPRTVDIDDPNFAIDHVQR